MSETMGDQMGDLEASDVSKLHTATEILLIAQKRLEAFLRCGGVSLWVGNEVFQSMGCESGSPIWDTAWRHLIKERDAALSHLKLSYAIVIGRCFDDEATLGRDQGRASPGADAPTTEG